MSLCFKFLLTCALALFCICFVSAQKTDSSDPNRIVGGTLSNITRHKYLVNIRQAGSFICGGTLVSRRHVVTAAHCVKNVNASQLVVTGGSTTLKKGGVRRFVSNVYIPTNYRNKTLQNDVAVLKLTKAINGTNIQPIKLCNKQIPRGALVRVSGWGQTSFTNTSASTQVRTVLLRMISKFECRKKYAEVQTITYSMICANSTNGKDACIGDSGGPLIYGGRLCGIVSFGISCASGQYPGVYTSVRAVKPFILSAMKK